MPSRGDQQPVAKDAIDVKKGTDSPIFEEPSLFPGQRIESGGAAQRIEGSGAANDALPVRNGGARKESLIASTQLMTADASCNVSHRVCGQIRQGCS